MTKRAGVLVLIFALFSGLIASATVMKYVKQLHTQQTVAKPMASVLVTKVSIPAGGSILANQVELAQRAVDGIPAGSIKSLKDAEGRVVRSTLYPGEIVLEERLIKRGSLGGLPSLIPKGMRAITLKVDDTIGVSGFIRPGNYVDVLTTVDIEGDVKETVTKTILQSIQVIATGNEIENADEDKKAKVVPTVTVLVNLDQAERLSLAVNAGTIRLVLRNHEDLEPVLTEGVTLTSLIPQFHPELKLPVPVLAEEEVAIAPTPVPVRAHVIEVYRGAEKSEVMLVP